MKLELLKKVVKDAGEATERVYSLYCSPNKQIYVLIAQYSPPYPEEEYLTDCYIQSDKKTALNVFRSWTNSLELDNGGE